MSPSDTILRASLLGLAMLSTRVAGAAGAGSAVPGESRFAPFGTHRVHYQVTGRGSNTLVFVHGWGGSTSVWREQIPALADHARLILVDLPGHGRSDKPERDYPIDHLARGVIAVLDDARVRRATLAGHSMGVAVVARVCQLAPDRVSGLVAVDGFLRRPEIKPAEVEPFIALFRSPDYRAHTTQFIGSMFPNPGTAALRDRVVAEILQTPQHVLRAAMEGMFLPGAPSWNLEKVEVPVLVLNAPNPMWTPEYEAYARSRSARTEYRMLEGVGHFLMLEQPAAFNREFLALLRRFDLIAP